MGLRVEEVHFLMIILRRPSIKEDSDWNEVRLDFLIYGMTPKLKWSFYSSMFVKRVTILRFRLLLDIFLSYDKKQLLIHK